MNFVKSLDEFMSVLRQHEIDSVQNFVVAYTPKSFTKDKSMYWFGFTPQSYNLSYLNRDLRTRRRLQIENIKVSEGLRLHWQDGIPYFHFGTRGYACHQGRDRSVYQKIKYARKRIEKAMMENSFVKQYNRTKITKKLGCPAMIRVTRVYRMIEYNSPFLSKKRKERISSIIRKKISAGEDLNGEEGYIFDLPSIDDHEHPLTENSSAIIEPVDENVKYYITSLVYEGKTDAAEIAGLLENFVENEMNQFDRSRRRFYPDMKTIRRIVNQAKNNVKKNVGR